MLYANYSNKEGKGVYPGQDTMMKLSGYKSRTTITKVTTVLKESGLIIPEGRSEYKTLEWAINLNWKGKRKDVEKEIKNYKENHDSHTGVHSHMGVNPNSQMGGHSNSHTGVHNPLVKPLVNPLKKNEGINNNKGNKEKITIITAKNKKAFAPLETKILAMGWVGNLDEIIKMHNEYPERVKAWVEEIDKMDLHPRAGLLLDSLRSGVKPSSKKERESARRNRFVEDEFAEFIEN